MKPPETAAEAVARILADPRVVWFPVKHFSPACARHVGALIRELRPAGVLVEGPEDATDLIPWIVHPDTCPPITILSSYVDARNRFGMNGVLSPSEHVPARFRAWWPLTVYAPEYAALVAGAEVGARCAFIDLPLTAQIPFDHVRRRAASRVVDDVHLATNAYFEALSRKQRRRSFEEFWNANFETAGAAADPRRFMEAALTFAWCARRSAEDAGGQGLEVDGTLAREAHMRHCVDRFLKETPEGRVVVVTGAFHSAVLPLTKRKKGKVFKDQNLETILTSHSQRALASLYALNRLPEWGRSVWEAMEAGSRTPCDEAGLRLLLAVMRRARELGAQVSTADAVGAWTMARNLATLRRDREVTPEDLLDAVQSTLIKGDRRIRGGEVERAAREVMVGQRLGRVTSEAGQAPLFKDFYASARRHRLDISGAARVVKLDLHRRAGHRTKSAFLHQCDFLELPLFTTLEGRDGHFRGPDFASGVDLHLIGETWGIAWTELVDDRLLELADRGASVAQAAAGLLEEQLEAARGDAASTSALLLRAARMALVDRFDKLLDAVEEAVGRDPAFDHLVKALSDFVLLFGLRDTLATRGHGRVLDTIGALYDKAALVIPGLNNTAPERADETLDQLQTLVRVALTFQDRPLDRELLAERLQLMVWDADGAPAVRGAGYGVLYALGATREKVVARELTAYLRGGPRRALGAGAFLDGLFTTSKSIFMVSPRLLRAVNGVLSELDWETFKVILPDLRRAFTRFIPSELDRVAERVGETIGVRDSPDPDAPVPPALARLGAAADRRASALLEGWI